ncbi:MAG: hypothetical protein KTR25_20595 [Myxococcales bacterium]|nr:hypothetical protein [Myxococcales bacterium]
MPKPLVPVRSKRELDRRSVPTEGPDHKSLHSTVVRSVVGAGVGAFVADILCRLLDTPTASSKLFLVLVAAGAFSGIALRGRRWMTSVIGGGLGSLGSFASSMAAQWIPFSAGLIGMAATPVLGERESPKRKLLTGIVAGILGYSGLHIAQIVLQAGWLTALVPDPLAAAGAGAMAGLFIGLATAPRYLLPEANAVESAFALALQRRDGEIHSLLGRALEIYRSVRAETHPHHPNAFEQQLHQQVSDHVMRILYIAEHCRRIEDDLSPDAIAELEDRMAELEVRSRRVTDDSARGTFGQALTSLREQQQAMDMLKDGRERVIARLHVNVALLEKLRLSFLQLGTADVERAGAETSPVVEALDELGRELDATAHAISEVFGASSTIIELPQTVTGSSPSTTTPQ